MPPRTADPAAVPDDARLWLQFQARPDRHPGNVRTALVEPGAVCNLRCPYCATGNGTQRLSRELLGPERFAAVLDALGPGLKTLRLFHQGEPLLVPGLAGMIRTASERGVTVDIHSHLSVPGFTRARAEELVRSGLALLTVSCDGATQAGYRLYRVGGRLSLVLRNLRLLLAAKRRLGSATPDIEWKFLVQEGNRAEVPAARRMAARLGVPIRFAPLLAPGAPAADVGPHAFNCLTAWDQPTVHADGSVLPCCVPTDPAHALGNILEEPLDALWNKPLVVAMRRYLRTGERAAQDLPCYSCPLDPARRR